MNTRLDVLIVGTGAIFLSVSLDYGLGVSFSHFWWAVMFWAGFGLLLGWVKAR